MANRACMWEGEVTKIGQLQKFDSGFQKRTLECVEDPSAKYKTYAEFTFKKDNVSLLDGIGVGDKVKIAFHLDGRLWENPKSGDKRVFNGLDVCKIEVTERAHQSKPVPPPAEPDDAAGLGDTSEDDIPF